MNAGLVFIPDGISAFATEVEGETIAESIARSALDSVERETAQATVTPKVIQGPPELGDKIKRISLSDSSMRRSAKRRTGCSNGSFRASTFRRTRQGPGGRASIRNAIVRSTTRCSGRTSNRSCC